MKTRIKYKILTTVFLLVAVFVFEGCSSSRTKYRKEYAKVWKEVIKSEAWKDALASKKATTDAKNLSASTEGLLILKQPGSFKSIKTEWFVDKYASLVSRAYFKIIAEAEDADKRLQEDHTYWIAKSKTSKTKDKELKKRLEIVNRKYEAHNNMLLGLKSWNIFSGDKSGDLDYFKAENEEAIYKMYLQGLEEKTMISYLVFKLADLYHFEE